MVWTIDLINWSFHKFKNMISTFFLYQNDTLTSFPNNIFRYSWLESFRYISPTISTFMNYLIHFVHIVTVWIRLSFGNFFYQLLFIQHAASNPNWMIQSFTSCTFAYSYEYLWFYGRSLSLFNTRDMGFTILNSLSNRCLYSSSAWFSSMLTISTSIQNLSTSGTLYFLTTLCRLLDHTLNLERLEVGYVTVTDQYGNKSLLIIWGILKLSD